MTTPIGEAYRLEVDIAAGGVDGPVEAHVVDAGDATLRWFTDCGEPLGSSGRPSTTTETGERPLVRSSS